jgi:hypothetical protein
LTPNTVFLKLASFPLLFVTGFFKRTKESLSSLKVANAFNGNFYNPYAFQQMYGTALFWADKVLSLSYEDPQDVYWLAQCMFLTGQYVRAENIIISHGVEKVSFHILKFKM